MTQQERNRIYEKAKELKLNENQLHEIQAAITNGLSVKQIDFLLNDYSADKMLEYRYAFERGLSVEGASLIANIKTETQIDDIRYGLEIQDMTGVDLSGITLTPENQAILFECRNLDKAINVEPSTLNEWYYYCMNKCKERFESNKSLIKENAEQIHSIENEHVNEYDREEIAV